MSKVFVSYKAEDRRRIEPLVRALQADGYSVWWDQHIGTGDEWRQTIERELDSAKCVLVVWSKRSVGPDGNFVRDEASRAQKRRVYVPVLIDAVNPPLGFGESQAASLRGWKGDRSDPNYQAVLSGVRRIAGAGTQPKSRDADQVPVSRRAVVATGAMTAVAIAGAGGWVLLKPSRSSGAQSIAVLPFANLSGDPGQAYFSDGIAEELRNALARLAGLKVVGRTSSEAVRDEDAATAAKKLGVANILTGSVRQSPSTIRISAQLVDGGNGIEKWSENYDRAPGDAIKIQTDIAEKVATALSATLGAAARTAVTIGGTQNADAQRLVIQSGAIVDNSFSKESVEHGLLLLDKAIQIDPNYAAAYARKAALTIAYGNRFSEDALQLAQTRADAARLASTAVGIAPDFPEAHFALATIYSSNLQVAAGYREIKRAIQLAPGNAFMLTRYANFAGGIGHGDEALRAVNKAIALDPLNKAAYNERLRVLYRARRYGDVAEFAENLKRQAPQMFDAPEPVGNALVMLKRYREAQAYYSQMAPDFWARLTGEAVILARMGDREGAERKIDALQRANGDAASYQYGEIYAQLGDFDRAFENLDHGFEIKDAGLFGLKVDGLVDPIRSDPRFAALLRKMNFPS